MDQLFEDLRKASSATDRQALVSDALQSGFALDEVREMLDCLESFDAGSCRACQLSCSKVKTRSNGSWTSFFNGLIYRYR